MIDKQKHREFRLQVAKIFFEEWDPIGIKDFSDSYDEYDNYVGTVCAKIWEGEGKEDILEYMFWAQSEYMGLGGSKEKIDQTNKLIVDKIFKLHQLYKY